MTTSLTTPEAPVRAAPRIERPDTDAHAEPKPYRFTADQALKMAEHGIFHPDDRLELIEGELISMVPPGPMHSTVSDEVARAFIEIIGRDQAHIRVGGSIQIGDGSLLVPDLALLKPRADRYMYELPTPQDIILVIEVFHSTLRLDRTRKLALYARVGIPAYWILNVADGVIEAHTDPVDGEYTTHNIYRPGDTVTIPAFPEITIAASDLIPPTNEPSK